jgi:hypothetical protein
MPFFDACSDGTGFSPLRASSANQNCLRVEKLPASYGLPSAWRVSFSLLLAAFARPVFLPGGQAILTNIPRYRRLDRGLDENYLP